MTTDRLAFDDSAIAEVIDSYTREAGVRNLEREIANVIRAVAVLVAEGKAQPAERVTHERIAEFLGPAKHISEVAERTAEPGVATGLAWTPVGGDILFIEATKMNGKGQLVLTGQLGDVMKESAQAALSLLRGEAAEFLPDLEIDPAKWFGEHDIHLHVPAGAVPKDGPSAGVAMLTALTSLLSGRPVRNDVAMTGEITLSGQVLPVGGLKEKSLAAQRAGINRVIVPDRNEGEILEIPEGERGDLEFVYVSEAAPALAAALEPARSRKR